VPDDPASVLSPIRERWSNRRSFSLGFDPVDGLALLAAVEAALKLAARWQSFGDGEDAQSECAAELREAIMTTLSGSGTVEDIVAASIEQQSAYRNELRHLPGYLDGRAAAQVTEARDG
jgi:hypothetical protein